MKNNSQRLLTIEEVVEITGLSRATVYRKIKRGRFPVPIKLSPRRVAWWKEEIELWTRITPRADLDLC